MGEELLLSIKGGPPEANGMSGLRDEPRTTSNPERGQRELSANVDRERLLAQIAQGLLTAHARLDLMEERLKEVASQAVARSLAPGLAALDQVHRRAQDGLTALSGTVQTLDGVEARLRGAV